MKSITIATRASKLALTQAEMLSDALHRVHPQLSITLTPMTTAGDRELHKHLADWGYKGLFTKELEDALLSGKADMAVHSMKDVPSILPDGLVIGAVLPRDDVRDGFISKRYDDISKLPTGAVFGTSSARRAAQLLHIRPDVNIVPFRGNVQTRLSKLEEGIAEATFLAAAGLNRLGLGSHIRSYIPTELMLPAAAQGAIGVEYAAERSDILELLAPIHHTPTATCITAERAFLLALDGSCRTPIGGLAELHENQIHLRGEVLSLDGKIRHARALHGNASDAEALGHELGAALRRDAGADFVQHGGC